jgi:VanZ family protein
MNSPFAQHSALSRGACALAFLVSLAVLFAPPSDVPSSPPGVDKVVHLTLFLGLSLTGRWAGIGRPVVAGLYLAYAALTEVVQGLDVVGRDASVADWFADAVGVLAGLALWASLTRSGRSAPH